MYLVDHGYEAALSALLGRYRLNLELAARNGRIPGSYWGEPEAGVVGAVVHARGDTPVHSVLHETAHVVCMDSGRRAGLHTDAGGEYAEENAVCCLQIVLARELGISAPEMCTDMDAWGYTFRLGSAYAWYTRDADDAREWLLGFGLLTPWLVPTWQCRGSSIPSSPAAANFRSARRGDRGPLEPRYAAEIS